MFTNHKVQARGQEGSPANRGAHHEEHEEGLTGSVPASVAQGQILQLQRATRGFQGIVVPVPEQTSEPEQTTEAEQATEPRGPGQTDCNHATFIQKEGRYRPLAVLLLS